MTQHVLSASGVTVGGRPRAMLPPTDVELHTGEVRALVGEPGHGHTALALILAGRLRPDAGSVALDRSVLDRTRQSAVALVDVPGVSEPDELVPFGTVLGEELAMARQPARRSAVRAWAPDVEPGRRTEDIPAARRTELLLRAAALRSGVHFLVLTLPDRWGVTPAEWQPTAAELAAHGYGVLVTVGETSRHLLEVPHADLGGAA
jgi:ABC-type branched-subunit amino acid transport system ATPase component